MRISLVLFLCGILSSAAEAQQNAPLVPANLSDQDCYGNIISSSLPITIVSATSGVTSTTTMTVNRGGLTWTNTLANNGTGTVTTTGWVPAGGCH
jgi:hypothetical protein